MRYRRNCKRIGATNLVETTHPPPVTRANVLASKEVLNECVIRVGAGVGVGAIVIVVVALLFIFVVVLIAFFVVGCPMHATGAIVPLASKFGFLVLSSSHPLTPNFVGLRFLDGHSVCFANIAEPFPIACILENYGDYFAFP